VSPLNRPALTLAVLGVFVALAGLPRLTVDPDAPFRLAEDDPMAVADAALRATTGGDDLLAAVVWQEDGAPLSREALAYLDELYEGLLREPALTRTRSPLRAPLLQSEGGVLSAATPLHPLPDGDTSAGLAALRADAFVAGTLLSEDGTLAILPSWIARDPADTVLVRLATSSLADAEVRATAAGKAAKQAVEQARLAVVLGTATGTADEEVAKALRALAPTNELASDWVRRADAIAKDPDAAAVAQIRAVLAGAAPPAGVRAAAIGEGITSGRLAALYPIAVALLIGGLLLGLGLSGGSSSPRSPMEGVLAALVGGLAAGFTVGAMAWLGAPQHSLTALAPIVAAALACAAWLGAPGVGRALVMVAPALGLGIATGSTPGAVVSFGAAAAAVIVVAGLRGGGGDFSAARSPVPSLVVAALGVGAVVAQPLGIDPAALLSARTPAGAAMQALDAAGMATSGQLALLGDGERPLAKPDALEHLRAAQQELAGDPAVAGTVSWADFVARLHGAVSGEDGLPADPALVDQYLLLFGRPDDVRPLVAPDLSVGGGMVRMKPGRGAELGRLAGEHTGVVVTGGPARVTRAGRALAAHGGAGWLLGLVIALGLLFARGSRDLSAVAAATVAVATSGFFAGAVGAESLVAGAVAWGCVVALGRSAWGVVLGGLALFSPAVGLASVGLGLIAGGAVALSIGPPRALARLSSIGHKTVN